MTQAHKPAMRQRGLALVVVLWAAVLLALIAGGVTRLARSDLNLARNLAETAQAELAADSALWTAVYRIAGGGPDAWSADGTIYAWRFADADLRVRVTDELGRIDINATTPDLLAALLVAAGIDPEGASAIAGAVARYRSGASADDPEGFLPSADRETRFALTDELLRVPGMSREIFDRIAPALTVYTGQPAPRRGRGTPLVLAALEGRVADDPAEDVATGTVVTMEGADAAMPLPVEPEPSAPATTSVLLHVEAEAAREGGYRFAREAVIELRRGGAHPYRIRLWRRGSRSLFPEAEPAGG